MNNKGFTLIEVLSVLVLVSIVLAVVTMTVGTTMSASKEEAYKLMKNNIVSAGYNYINECNLGTIDCDFSFEDNNKFSASVLRNTGFFKNLDSPIDGKDLGTCLVLDASKSNGVVAINIIDNCYDEKNDNVIDENTESTNKDKINQDKPNKDKPNKDKNNKDKNNKDKPKKQKINKNKADKGNKDKVYNKVLDKLLELISHQ